MAASTGWRHASQRASQGGILPPTDTVFLCTRQNHLKIIPSHSGKCYGPCNPRAALEGSDGCAMTNKLGNEI
jgi:hypothetical protein